MKLIIIFITLLGLSFALRFAIAGQSAKTNPPPSLDKKQLQSCPDKPNCICTEYPGMPAHFLPSIDYPATQSQQIVNLAKIIILEMGGEIIHENKHYLAATFTSSIFKFVDDFELRNDSPNHTLHIRSASRVGYSDFGVNKRRVKKFTSLLNTALNK